MNYKIKSKIWIEADGEVVLGEGRVRLLKAIAETGSLSKAAILINISYKKAWYLLNSINHTAKEPVTINAVGGKGGGGAVLTTYGIKLIKTFDIINQKCWKFLDQELDKIKDH